MTLWTFVTLALALALARRSCKLMLKQWRSEPVSQQETVAALYIALGMLLCGWLACMVNGRF